MAAVVGWPLARQGACHRSQTILLVTFIADTAVRAVDEPSTLAAAGFTLIVCWAVGKARHDKIIDPYQGAVRIS